MLQEDDGGRRGEPVITINLIVYERCIFTHSRKLKQVTSILSHAFAHLDEISLRKTLT